MYWLLNEILYFLGLTLQADVLWNVVPLAFATIILVFYFEKYKDERPGWETFLSNTLVLVFVAMALFRHIYGLSPDGFYNFVDYPAKTITTTLLLLIGALLTRFNFEHLLPEKYTEHLSSVLTVNIVAYVVILFVFSERSASWESFLALIIIVIILSIILHAIKRPLKKIFKYTEKEKRKERLNDIKEAKYQLKELKQELAERSKELNKIKFNRLEKEKKEAIRLEKVLRK